MLVLWVNFFVILGSEFSLDGSGRLRFVKPQTTLYTLRAGIGLIMTGRIYVTSVPTDHPSKQLCTSEMPSGGLSKNSRTRRNF